MPKKSYHKKANNNKIKFIQGRYADKDFICISPEWIKWAKRYMNRYFRRKNKQQKYKED